MLGTCAKNTLLESKVAGFWVGFCVLWYCFILKRRPEQSPGGYVVYQVLHHRVRHLDHLRSLPTLTLLNSQNSGKDKTVLAFSMGKDKRAIALFQGKSPACQRHAPSWHWDKKMLVISLPAILKEQNTIFTSTLQKGKQQTQKITQQLFVWISGFSTLLVAFSELSYSVSYVLKPPTNCLW